MSNIKPTDPRTAAQQATEALTRQEQQKRIPTAEQARTIRSGNPASTTAQDRPGVGEKTGVDVGIVGLTVRDAQAQLARSKSAFSLLPGRYPDAVGLPDVLGQLANGAEGRRTVEKLAAHLERTTGIKPSPKLLRAVIKDPSRFAELMVLTPKQLSTGIDALNLAHKAGKVPGVMPMPARLPSGFDLAGLDRAPVERPEAVLKEIAPGLLQGDLRNDALSDADAKRNIVMAEVLDRLSSNAEKPAKERFSVRYGGGEFTRLEPFLARLAEDGHSVEVSFSHRVANFANLKTKAPDGTVLDVPAALLVRTGITNDAGKEAVLPAVHSEMIVRITSGENTKGPKLDADVKWYQGISGTGFFPCDLMASPSWCGQSVSDTLRGADALRAVHLAGLTSDVINASAAAQDLAVGGYGATGVCNDSVALVQQLLTGKTAAYPLLMRDDTLYAELDRRLGDRDRLDDPEYRAIRAGIDALPSDVEMNDTVRTRAKTGGMPWAPGREPFQIIVDARDILG